ncbi:hypothetical protein AOQ84DRAFT_352949 [Glonium stellatum]|uniref:Zn(2)-C6 fungal-type domain-containing protein n=1 Tax=Glonium stellatum TaxID=574774 RepID=A0A8E2F784_9PEZI|nr:hypothetical protein AOQ84DRAFT_352949 [Glonium stellatum]
MDLPSSQQCSDNSIPYVTAASNSQQKDANSQSIEPQVYIWPDQQVEIGYSLQEEAAGGVDGIPHTLLYAQQLTLGPLPPSDSSAWPQFRGCKRSTSPINIPGCQSFDWNIAPGNSKPQTQPQPRKRQRKTGTQREQLNRVREKGSCLRCYVQKQKCSEGVPCAPCAGLISRGEAAVRPKTLQWTACISSSLLDMNVFTYGISLIYNPSPSAASVEPNAKKGFGPVSTTLFDMVWKLTTEGGPKSLLSKLDSLYNKIVRYIYGSQTEDIHAFILKDRNPLNFLVQLNTVLLGNEAVQGKSNTLNRHVRWVRGVCGEFAFRGLEKSLDRNHFASSTITRQYTLIIYIALVLEQVLEIGGGRPGSPSDSSDLTYQAMHNHLVQYLFYYFRRLCSNVFPGDSPVMRCIGNASGGVQLSGSFWCELSQATGCGYLQKPPKLREYSHFRNDFAGENFHV